MGKPSSMPDKPTTTFAIVRFNARTYDGGVVIAVIKGRANAELNLAEIQGLQETGDWSAGWRYFIEPSDLTPGMDPQEATRVRQALFERRESKHR